ncbi:ATP-binding protein [Pelagibacterium montanilacus]|uniref:ATP-binding protein n=1 Tax=Pelagibacterium montanilacus TaxID=2185280 RepID=UPI001FE80322|nr:AAA family ATPase [Pelagibacterium montanilacus]
MRLRRLDLTRYGKFTDFSLDFGVAPAGGADLHIVYGLNEAGKSTSLSAYLDLLFGIEERTRYGFLHQGKAMEIGGCLEFEGQAHELRRVKQRANSLLDAGGQPANEAMLGGPLAGLSREAYRMMFSLDDQTLEDGGDAILESKGDLGELLFSASAGLAGISAILETATAEADAIFRKRASTTRIAVLKREIAELKSRREEIDVQASAYKAITTALEQASSAYDAVMGEIGATRARIETIARIRRAIPLVGEYHGIAAELEPFEGLPHPPADWDRTVLALIEDQTRLETRLAGLGERDAGITADLETIEIDHGVLAMSDRLDRLTELGARHTAAEGDLPRRRAALEDWTRKLDLIVATLGQTGADPRSLLVPAATIGVLRELIACKSGVDVAHQAAVREHEAASRALDKARSAQAAIAAKGQGIDAGGIAHLQSILARLRQSELSSQHRLAVRSLPEKEEAYATQLDGLDPWAGTGDALRKIAPPPASRIAHWTHQLAAIEARHSRCVDRIAELVAQRDADEARQAGLGEEVGRLDDAQAAAALAERDAAWARHRASLETETAEVFEAALQRTDALAAARLERVKEIEETRAIAGALATVRTALERQNAARLAAEAEFDALRAEIRAETPEEIALPEGASLASWLSRIERWAENRMSALMAWEDLRQTRREADGARVALEAEEAALGEALAAAGVEIAGLPLAALVQAGETLLAEHAALAAKRADAEDRLAEFAEALAERGKALAASAGAAEAWERDWTDALAGTWFADRKSSVGAVRALLDAAADLPEALREIEDLRHRIAAMEADRTAFSDAVGDLEDALGATARSADPREAARALMIRHAEAKKRADRKREREAARAQLAAEKDRLAAEIAEHKASMREMLETLGVETPAEAREALARCAARDQLAERQARIGQEIVAAMEGALETAMETLSHCDTSALAEEQAELATRLEDLDARSKDLFADKARAQDRLNAIGGDDAVARLEAGRRTTLLEIEDMAIRYLKLRTGSLVAEHGLRAYRDKHRSAMMERASQAFSLMTRGEYTGLTTQPDKDREALIGLAREGGSKLAADMSKGTRFQLYLALRLAGYEEFAAARPSVPFIADDIMETFDEPRSEEVFRLFGQMARTGQVIYLTHHRHLCDMAAQIVPEARIHELP